MSNDIRWKQRFTNFKRAYTLLQEAVDLYAKGNIDQLQKEGMIQRFEYCMELAWNTIKDYLENQSVVFSQITPTAVLKEAIAAKLLTRSQDWMDALDARNKMSHTYNFKIFDVVVQDLHDKYIFCFGELYEKLMEQYIEDNNA